MTSPPSLLQGSTPSEHGLAVRRQLLTNELATVRTYVKAIDRFGDDPDVAVLVRIRADHIASARQLRDAAADSGITFLEELRHEAVEAENDDDWNDLRDDRGAFDDLHHWEARGRHLYEETLHDPEVGSDLKALIAADLLPRQERHLRLLEALAADF